MIDGFRQAEHREKPARGSFGRGWEAEGGVQRAGVARNKD